MTVSPPQMILRWLEAGLALCGDDDLTYRLLQRAYLPVAENLLAGRYYPSAELARLSYESRTGSFDERIALLCAAFAAFFGAVDLVDCVEDHELPDDPWQEVGWEIALNTGVSCIFLAGRLIARLADLGVPDGTILMLQNLVAEQGWSLALGQTRDLARRDMDEAAVLRTYQGKTGSSVALYVKAGAVLAGASPAEADGWGRLGERLGVLIQLHNDYYDVFAGERSFDIENGSHTLPLVHLWNQPAGKACPALRAAFAGRGAEAGVTPAVREALAAAGTADYMSEQRRFWRQAVQTGLDELQAVHGVDVDPARRLLESRYRYRPWWPDDR
jgi:hypothetical protein